ncbi:MAG: nuclease [Myxococcales bacterium]|nr:nuclease [Myxococcales bacterium]
MKRLSLSIILVVTACAGAPKAEEKAPQPKAGQVLLDGVLIEAKWSDGDTFSWKDPANGEKRKARLVGFNTLEDYGPVHRWGEWSSKELYDLALEAGKVAAARGWVCEDTGSSGGYGRKAVLCESLREFMITEGYAHVLSMEGPGPTYLLKMQIAAQEAGKGIWKKGVPEGLVTSVHSSDEKPSGKGYNRVVSTRTGASHIENHENRYEHCQEVCHQGSCMVYIPYKLRYGPKKLICP